MFGTEIHRYITREILWPTLLCFVISTMVMMMGQAVKLVGLIIDKGVPLADILILLAALLPTSFSISLPLAFLMGIMIGLGRMSADSETVALKSVGTGLARISVPVFALAFIFALLTGATSFWVKPWGYSAFATKSYEIARQKATLDFQARVFMKQFDDLILYTNEIEDRSNQMRGLFIVEKKPESTSWIFADNGNIITDERSETLTIRLHDGVIHRQQSKSVDNYQLIHFRNYDIQLEISDMSSPAEQKRLKPRELLTGELWRRIALEETSSKVRELQAELHLRLTSTLAPLLFVLFGLPFSMQSQRSGRSGGFVMGLIILLGYYFMLSTAVTLTKEAAVPPWLTFWTPHLIMISAGFFFLRQSSLERPNLLVTLIDRSVLSLQKRVRKNVDS